MPSACDTWSKQPRITLYAPHYPMPQAYFEPTIFNIPLKTHNNGVSISA